MIDEDDLELLKVDLLILTAVFSAFQLDFDPNPTYYGLGVAFILAAIIIQLILMRPYYGDEGYSPLEKSGATYDFILGCHIVGLLFLVLGFAEYPNMQSDIQQGANMGLSTALILAGLGVWRYQTLKEKDQELAEHNLKQYRNHLCFLLVYFMAVYTFTVGF